MTAIDLEKAIEAKCREHAAMATREAELSLHIASTKNAQWRLKLQGDRKLISRRLTTILHEIEGLVSVLTENSYEKATA